MDYFLIWIFPALLLGGIGALLLLTTVKHIKRCEAVAVWSKTQATIESSGVEEHKAQRYNTRLRAGYQKTSYVPKIEYTYSVMGMPFRSSGYQNFNGEYSAHSEEEATLIAETYPVGQIVTISYDPNNPSDSLLLPETSTEKLNKTRKGQLAMVAIALVWFSIGTVINLTAIVREKVNETRINKSEGMLPGSAEEISAKFDPLVQKYQLTCQDDGTSGRELAYHVWSCRADPDSDPIFLEMMNRKEDLEKVDMLSAIYMPSDLDETATYFGEVAAIVFEGEELQTVQTWITDNLPTVAAGEGDATTNIGGIDLALNDLGGTVRLNIGDLQ